MQTHDGSFEAPPTDPATEEVTVDDESFVEECDTVVGEFLPRDSARLGAGLLTKTERWGLVWRADFTRLDSDLSPLINRIVCWRTDDGKIAACVAIGQSLAPLSGPDCR